MLSAMISFVNYAHYRNVVNGPFLWKPGMGCACLVTPAEEPDAALIQKPLDYICNLQVESHFAEFSTMFVSKLLARAAPPERHPHRDQK